MNNELAHTHIHMNAGHCQHESLLHEAGSPTRNSTRQEGVADADAKQSGEEGEGGDWTRKDEKVMGYF